MSKTSVYSLNCPRCGAENQVTVWESVNVTLDPDVKQMVLDGNIFEHQCPACSFTGDIDHPCLYHDMDRNLLIYLMPHQTDGDGGDLAENDMPSFPAEIMEAYVTRRVATVNRLREKVMIFDSGKDDRVMELYKWRVFENLFDTDPGFKFSEMYFISEEGERFIIFDEDGDARFLAFSPEVYLDIEKEFGPMFDTGSRPSFQTIDDAWAFSIINQR